MSATSSASSKSSRRRFLATAGAGLGAVLAPGVGSAAASLVQEDPTVWGFSSRPDLSPPKVSVAKALPATSPGSVLLAPFSGPGQHGPYLVDDAGDPVWFRPVATGAAMNLRAQRLAGKRVLTWWEGEVTNGYGQGEYVIADTSYREIKRFSPANGYRGDLHEFVITSRGTALVSVYHETAADLSAYGGPSDGTVLDGIVQEIELRTGTLLLEWRSLEHVGMDESYRPVASPWDYFHLNSIGVLPDGNLLVSARHTSTVYKLDRGSGKILWRLGGKRSDFEMGPDATFAYQHDARGHPGDLVSIFDNGAFSNQVAVESVSRAIVLALDPAVMTAQLDRADPSPHGLSVAMGNTQLLPDGGIFVGWGTAPAYSELTPAGELRYDAQLTGGGASYRAFRSPWKGVPRDRPAIAGSGNADGTLDVCVSWNGATEVVQWRLAGGASTDALGTLRLVPRTGFETRIHLARPPAFVVVSALDRSGLTLGTSRPLATAGL